MRSYVHRDPLCLFNAIYLTRKRKKDSFATTAIRWLSLHMTTVTSCDCVELFYYYFIVLLLYLSV